MLNTFPKITPVVSKTYRLCIDKFHALSAYVEVNALYPGFKEIITPLYQKLLRAEGHIFASVCSRKITLYSNRSNSSELEQIYISDGEEGPCYLIGIPAEELNISLQENESIFLRSRLLREGIKAVEHEN